MILEHKLRRRRGTQRPAFVTAAITTGSGTSINANAPGTISAGNLLFAIVNGSGSGGTLTAPSGWTVVATTPNRHFAYKTATASEPVTYTFNHSTSLSPLTVTILNYSNALVDVIGTTSAAATNASAPGITVSQNLSVVMLIVSVNTTNTTVSDPSGWTPRSARITTAVQVIWDRNFEAGATGDIGVTSSASGTRSSLVSLKPST